MSKLQTTQTQTLIAILDKGQNKIVTTIKNDIEIILSNKEEMIQLRKATSLKTIEVYKQLTALVTELRESSDIYKKTDRKVLIKLVKHQLGDIKSPIILTVCKMIESGYRLPLDLSMAQTNYMIKLLDNKRITNAAVKKMDRETIIKRIITERKKDKIESATNLLKK